MAVLSLVLYCMVDQMDSAILVHSLLIAFAVGTYLPDKKKHSMSRKFRHSAIILFPSGSDDIPLL